MIKSCGSLPKVAVRSEPFESAKSSAASGAIRRIIRPAIPSRFFSRQIPSALQSPLMPENSAPPSPQLYFETINAYQKTAALKAAIDLGLFTAIGTTPSTAAEIAARCQSPERGLRILGDYLTILGF